MPGVWLYVLRDYPSTASAIFALKRLGIPGLRVIAFCARRTSRWHVYAHIPDATVGQTVRIIETLNGYGQETPTILTQFREVPVHVILAGSLAQIGRGLRALAACSVTMVGSTAGPFE